MNSSRDSDPDRPVDTSVPWEPPLSVTVGMAVALLAAGISFFPGGGEWGEWRQYLLLGTLFPALLLTAGLLSRRAIPWWSGPFALVFGAYGIAACLVYALATLDWAAVAVAVAVTVAALAFEAGPAPTPAVEGGRRAQRLLPVGAVLFATLLGASHAFFRLGWWRLDEADHASQTLLGGAVLAGLAVAVGRVLGGRPGSRRPSRALVVAALLPVALFALAALRLPDFGAPEHSTLHHWGVFVAPAAFVRDGGLLLREVPAQYGTLSMAAIAWFPGVGVWEGMRLVNASALFASAVFLCFLLWASRPGPGGLVLATGLTVSSVYLLPGWPWDGPTYYPSTGAFRFWGVQAALGLALWESGLHQGPPAGTVRRWAPVGVGAVVWVVAVAWSVECGVYATAAWLPALAWSRFHLSLKRAPERGVQRAIGSAAAALGIQVGALGGVMVATVAWYRSRYGVDPDFGAYLEYALSYSQAFGTLPIDPWAAGVALFLILLVISAALVAALSDPDGVDRQVVALAAFGAVWASASYFVSRSHPNNVVNLTSVLLTAWAAVWYAWTRAGVPMPRDLRWTVAVWMAVVLFDAGARPEKLRPFVTSLGTDPWRTAMSRMPPPPPSLVDLMTEARVRPGDRIVFLDGNPLPPFDLGEASPRGGDAFGTRGWLPMAPVALVMPLPIERRQEYAERFSARRPLSGWYLTRNPLVLDGQPDMIWVSDLVDSRYRVVRAYENAEWRLEWRRPNWLPERVERRGPRVRRGRPIWPEPSTAGDPLAPGTGID